MGKDDPKIGELMTDGRLCAGISPRTGKHMYVNGRDGGDLLTWKEAQVAMKNLAPFGWRLPTKDDMAGLRMASRRADEKDSDPFRQRRLPALFMRAGSNPDPLVTFQEAQEIVVRTGGRLPSWDEVNPFPPKGEPKPGGPSGMASTGYGQKKAAAQAAFFVMRQARLKKAPAV